MQLPPGVAQPPPLHFAPFLSGKQLLTTQTFRDLFRSEVIRGDEAVVGIPKFAVSQSLSTTAQESLRREMRRI
jgi:hypothetical protein